MIKVVLDTNILVSANLQTLGLPALVFDLARRKRIQAYVSSPILAEYETVLSRPRLKFTSRQVAAILHVVHEMSVPLTDLPVLRVLADEKDNCFLECAQAAGAHYLVTGNTRHFPAQWKTTRRVTARELLEIIGPDLLAGR